VNRKLNVYLDKEIIGTLFENRGIWSFQYETSWVATGYSLAPGLPLTLEKIQDGGSIRPVQWFFDNLLPEDAARAQLTATLPVDASDAWSLLAHYGAESAGALTLLPPNTGQLAGGLQPLTDADLEARIRAMPRQPLAAGAPKKMSLAGARQKLQVVVGSDGKLFEPLGAQASTHILKPDVSSEFYPCSAVNEWFCARLAQELGLSVPPVQLRYVPSAVYIIERFDRKFEGAQTTRLHALDAVQLLTLSAESKYARSGVDALIDIVDKCRPPATTRLALFRWTLFNILIGNSDAHLKNLSVLAIRGGYQLAPHYDLLATSAWNRPELASPGELTWPDVPMSFKVGDATTYPQLTRQHLRTFARQLGVAPGAATREMDRMTGNGERMADKVRAEFEARSDVPVHVRASQLRMILAIIHLPIITMANQLRKD
jgi:serine/threonine-protein kinase HipA